jgi:hypothetical protein
MRATLTVGGAPVNCLDAVVAAIQAVLFDFGGVFTASPFVALREAASGFGVTPETVLATVFGTYDQDADHPWHQLERGEVTVERALAGIGELARQSGCAIDPIAVLSRSVDGGGLVQGGHPQARPANLAAPRPVGMHAILVGIDHRPAFDELRVLLDA